MNTVILTIHIILTLCLVAIVLLQRSEGGGLGIGGSNDNIINPRSAVTALSKITWGLAIGFIATSLTLTIIAARNASENSLIDINSTPDSNDNLLPPVTQPLDNNLLPPNSEPTPLLPPTE